MDSEDPSGETATNPTLLFEVLSKTTEGYDRGLKAESYRQIEGLQAYVLVSQKDAHVEMHQRNSEGLWVLHEARGLDAFVMLPGIEVRLPLSEIYDRVDFSPPE